LSTQKQRIAIFASGSGSNAEQFFRYFQQSELAEVALLICNKPDAYVLERARNYQVPAEVACNSELSDGRFLLDLLKKHAIDFIVLAGYLRLIPSAVAQSFHKRIVNIHPALLPSYGGKGMYGSRVHEAVVQAGEKESGISIHYVNEQYDEGDIIFQARCSLCASESPASLAEKVHKLEHTYYPAVVERLLREQGI
jgi:phosphoribosylglycinamide formyltransferase-1